MNFEVQVFNGGLAASEAVWQLAKAGTNKADRKKACTDQVRQCLRERLTGGSGIAAHSIESAA